MPSINDGTDESAPLNPAFLDEDASSRPPTRDTHILTYTSKPKRDPLYILLITALSFTSSVVALGFGFWFYHIVCTAPFTPDATKRLRRLYEEDFVGMQSVLFFLSINMIWTALSFEIARRGRQSNIWLLNLVYDFCLWGFLLAFGILNMLLTAFHLGDMDGNLCEGDDRKAYAICDAMMYQLLVSQLVTISLGYLVAVLHLILMIGRCFTFGRYMTCCAPITMRSLDDRIMEEEEVLIELMEMRRELVLARDVLRERRLAERQLLDRSLPDRPLPDRPLPPLPTGRDDGDEVDESALAVDSQIEERADDEDLIDMIVEERHS